MKSKPVDIYVDKKLKPNNEIVELWASNLYSRVNFILRNYPIDIQYKYTPRLFFFVQQFIKYFQEHGVYSKELRNHGRYLYRGLDANFVPEARYKDPGFIATSLDEKVACDFSTSSIGCGSIQKFRISNLPKDVPFVIIDESINSIFHEKEVLMLPGWIEKLNIANDDSNSHKSHRLEHFVSATYNCDYELLSQYINTPTPPLKKIKGGMYNMDKNYLTAYGKVFVFYRALQDKDVEILATLHASTSKRKYQEFLRYNICKTIHFFDNATQLIPDVQKLQLTLSVSTNSRKLKKTIDLLKTFNVHIAIYDPKIKVVVTLNVMLPMCLHEEMCCENRHDDIHKAIQEKMLLI